jgi:hypothetical protein
MAPRRKTSRLSVHFTNNIAPSCDKNSSATVPFFLTSNGISGIVDTTSLGSGFDCLKIYLDGMISVRIPQRQRLSQGGVDSGTPYRRLTQRTIALTQCLNLGSATGKTLFRFHLDIINRNNNLDCSRRSSRTLPPSLYHKKVASSPTSSQAETTEFMSSYTLSVCAVQRNAVVDVISLAVRIYDNSQVHPPAYQSTLSLDYPHHESNPFRRNLLSKNGTFSATALTEPTPIVFTRENSFATTTIPLQMTAETQTPISSLDASLTWRLRTSTIASILPMPTCPTMRQAGNAPCSMTSTSSLGLKHKIEMHLNKFSHDNGISILRQDLAIALPKSALIVPTTHTEYISRRYSVQIEIIVRERDIGKASVCFEIPVQVGYQDEDHMQAPRYREHDGVPKVQEQIVPALQREMSPPPMYVC